MKKILGKLKHNTLFGIIIGGIIFGSIGIYAASYLATDVLYTRDDSKINNVEAALNDLYNMKEELSNLKSIGTADASQIVEGETALVNGKLVTGTLKVNSEQIFDVETLSKKTWDDAATYTGECGTLKGVANGATFTATIDCTIKAYFVMSYRGSFQDSYIKTSTGCEVIQKMVDTNNTREYVIKVPKGETVTMFAGGYDYTSYSMGVICSKIF